MSYISVERRASRRCRDEEREKEEEMKKIEWF